jgi:16S rRNA (guanine527-N7)-methyltransferase
VYNLTAVRDLAQMLTQHVLDCLTALPAFVTASRVLDVGSGGGLPGVVLAIWAQHAHPHMQVHMIDTVHKKTAFLTQAKAELCLTNMVVHTGRVEEFNDEKKFDVITSRAFAELKDFVEWSGHLLGDGGKIIALKGQAQADELRGLPTGWEITKLERVHVPGLVAERHLVHIARTTIT